MRPVHVSYQKGEVVYFLGHAWSLHTWDVLFSLTTMLALLAIYYHGHWYVQWLLYTQQQKGDKHG